MSEVLNGFFVLLLVLGLLTGIVTLLVLLVMAIRKDKLKAPLWVAGSAFFIAFIGFMGSAIISTVETFNEPVATSGTESDYSGVEVDGMTDEEIEETIDNAVEGREDDLANEELTDEEIEANIEESAPEEDEDDPENLDNYRADVDVRDIERNPDDYKNELIALEGKIIQVMEEDSMTFYRIAVNDDYDRIVLLSTLTSTLEERLLEDDYVAIYGGFDDLVTYETVIGGSATVPAFTAHGERIVLNENVE